MTADAAPLISLPTIPESRDKVLRSMANTGYLTVWEGAVRSGKTVFALVAFVLYAVRSPERRFLLSGRTIRTIEKNCIRGEHGIEAMLPGCRYGMDGKDLAITFSVPGPDGPVEKSISVLGASDIRAYMSLRGNSYGGWFADEINMHDPEFVSEALRRTVVSKDRRHFWTLNPDNPHHWVYADYLDKYDAMDDDERRELGGYRWWHFTPQDNPIMTPKMLRSLELQYPAGSYLYDRYVLGLRCVAEGLVYPKVTESYFRDFDKSAVDVRYCAIDFGADHPTVMLWGGIFGGNRYDWRIVAEYYDEKSDKTTYDHYCGYLDVCRKLGVDPAKVQIAIDPAAKALRLEFLKHGLQVIRAKNDVLPGIEFTRSLIYDGRLSFHSDVKDLMSEFGSYAWDPKASERGEDKPIKIHDDRMDTLRYFAYTFARPVIGYDKERIA